MIACYEGTLGGGKSYHAVRHVLGYLAKGGRVYTNIGLIQSACEDFCRRRYGVELDWANQVYPIPLASMGKLNRFVVGGTYDCPTLCVCDEMHLYANSRDWATADRGMLAWLTQSRKLHVDIIFITQHRNNMDKQWVRLVGEFWRFKDLRKWVVPGLGLRLPWVQMLAVRIDTDGKTVLLRNWERIDKDIFACYSSDQLFDGFADCAGRGQGRLTLAKSKRRIPKMYLIVILVASIGISAYLLISHPLPFIGRRDKDTPSLSVPPALASSAPPAPASSSPPAPASPAPVFDMGKSWYGTNGRILGGQGESGRIYDRPCDAVVDGVPAWLVRPVPRVPRGTKKYPS